MKSYFLAALALAGACAAHPAPAVPDPYREAAAFSDAAAYREARSRLIAEERSRRLDAALVVSADEEKANRALMAMKHAELDRTRANFPPARSFLLEKTKQMIGESPVFEVMRRLPKGAVLHAHGGAMGDFRWLLSQTAHRPDAYINVNGGAGVVPGALRLAPQHPGEGWRPISELRAAARDAEGFDEQLLRSITLGEEDLTLPDIWAEFATIFRRVSGLMTDRSIHAEYWRRMMASLIDDNVQYLESRSAPVDPAILQDVRRVDPEFDIKFIPVAGRSVTRERLAQILSGVVDARVKDPDRVKGFDLVDEEDRHNTNLFYLEEILAARREAEQRGTTLPLYLHSGESNWVENENLYDAVLLGASRIGHGIALFKHPRLMEIVKARGVAVEVCPTSNQILGFVADLRNHPAVHYINSGLAVVLSPDDSAIMRNSISHDFYEAFMAWGLDLRGLKQLALNSLRHSAMNAEEKRRALEIWERRWDTFVRWINEEAEGRRQEAGGRRRIGISSAGRRL
jgi:adenosine deaminase CECR1